MTKCSTNPPSKETKIKQIRELPALLPIKIYKMSQYDTLKNTQIDIPFESHT